MLRRRDLLGLLPTFGVLACHRETNMPTTTAPPTRAPVLFVAHGAPPLLDDPEWIEQLAAWGRDLPRPQAILMVSAHWEARPLTLGATRPVPLIYDFFGFPDRFYRLQYASPGAPALAERVRALVSAAGLAIAESPERGLDHGAYIPLMCMVPQADIPVLQISMPCLDPQELYALGRILAPLRDEGVLIVGSGFLTHNLRSLRGGPNTPAWAREFDQWIGDLLTRGDHDSLLDYRHQAPALHLAHPTEEHFAPILVAAGAAGTDPARFPITGFWFGSFSKRSVQFG